MFSPVVRGTHVFHSSLLPSSLHKCVKVGYSWCLFRLTESNFAVAKSSSVIRIKGSGFSSLMMFLLMVILLFHWCTTFWAFDCLIFQFLSPTHVLILYFWCRNDMMDSIMSFFFLSSFFSRVKLCGGFFLIFIFLMICCVFTLFS